ncbi:MAG: M55 family metallopeptidase [Proteobacteria bacterium]|nr:M55 family metallopeptidase [Pseudomonadota bacterium]
MKTHTKMRQVTGMMGRLGRMAILSLGLVSISAASGFAQEPANPRGLRIFISVDMEGVTGVVMPNQLAPGGNEYEHFRTIMTNEVNAAIAGARKAGATEFVVADAHGNFQNLLIDQLPKDARIVRGEPRPLIMMDGVDRGKFDGAMFIGYHASSVSLGGVRAHSFSSAVISQLKINGVPASEGYWNAAIAGDFNVPLILASGDDIAMAELKPVAKNAELVAVKRALGFHAAETLTPAAGNDLIEKASERAVRNLSADAPFRIKGPVTVDLTFHFYQPAELLAWLPSVQRTGARSVRFKADNMVEATKFLAFISSYNIGLQP